MFRTGVARGLITASRPARQRVLRSPFQTPWTSELAQPQNGFHAAVQAQNGFGQESALFAPIMSTRPILPEPVHDLVGDAKMPGQMEGEVGVKSVALRDIKEGEVVFRESGEVISDASMHSIQIGRDRHLNIRGETRFLSHSNEPNCKVSIFEGSTHPIDIVAIKDLPKGTALTFDYATTEWDMDSPFDDCESGQRCAGFKHLSTEERKKRLQAGLLPSHIMELWLAEVTSAE